MRKHPGSPMPRRLRGAALVLASVLAVLVIAPAAGAASTRTAAAGGAPAAAATARAASLAASGAPGGRIVLAKADPCAALFGSVKQACENFGKSGSGSSATSVTDIPGQVEQAVDSWFGDLVKSALTPILTLLGKLVLSTPDMTGGRIGQIYTITLGIADAVFVLLVVVGGVIVMGHETIQTRYAIKQILPRLVLGFIAANLSIHFVSRALQFGNALTQAIWSTPLSGAGIGNQLLGYILTSIFLPDGVTQVFMVLFGLVLAVLALAVVFSFALRTAGLLLLVILAPPMLLCHALPGLDAIAFLWWRLLAALLAIGFLQASVLMLMLQVFFDPDSNVLGIPTSAGLIDLVVCGALFVILLKIPGWVLRMVLGRAPRSSVMGLFRTAATAAIGTAIGVPGAGSARILAARFGGRAAATGLGSTPPPGAAGAGRRPAWANPIRHAQRFGTAHGRPTASGQGVLFPIPKGARLTGEQVRRRAAIRSGHARGGWPTPAPKAAKRPRFTQPTLFDRDGTITPAANPQQAPHRVSRQRQETLFPIPEGARLTRAQARQRLERLQPSRSAWHPGPAPGRSPYRQPALFNRQGRLHPDVRAAATPRPPAASARGTGTSTQPRTSTPTPRPASSTPRARPATPTPTSGAPSVPGRAMPQAPSDPAPRMVPVRMSAAPKPRKRRQARKSNRSQGGEQP